MPDDAVATFLDSHVHLADPAFAADVVPVLDRATEAGAIGVICIGESLETAERARDLASGHAAILAWTAGIHPHAADSFDAARDLPRLRTFLGQGAAAVGECGLDYHYDNSPRDVQRAVFGAQLDVARETRRPVVVHTRDADADTIAMLREAAAGGVIGVLHCFSGSSALADAAVAAGWYLSLSGIITFAKWGGVGVLRELPVERLLVESDAPYLAPVPHRGRRNEPAWVAHTLQRLAEARGVPIEILAPQIVANTRRFFGLAA